jgi:hypothetical protein
MGVLVIQKEGSELSPKARSIRYLHDLGFPTPNTLVVPMYSEGDHFALNEIGQARNYYVRLCFRDTATKSRAGRIVSARDVEQYVAKLAEISALNVADLVIQPFIVPTHSGAVLKLGNTMYVELANGIAPTLFHKGRCSYRAILTGEKLIYSESIEQDLTLVWDKNSIVVARESAMVKYDPESIFFQMGERLGNLDNILLEWCVINDSLVFFDHKDLHSASGFLELRQSPPVLPRSVSATLDEVREAPLTKRVLFLDYPDLEYLSQARAADYVVVKNGALLSHVSVYSIHENYKCVFA